jgi:hypothetical protein
MTEVANERPKPANGAAPAEPQLKPLEPDLATRKAELKGIAEAERQKHSARQRERAEFAQAQERAGRAEKAAADAAARVAALESEFADPVAFLRKRGVTARELGERIVREGSTEEQLEKAIAGAKAAEEKSDALRRELEQREARSRLEAQQLQARKALLDSVLEAAPRMPLLSQMSQERVISEYMRTYQDAASHPDTREMLRSGQFSDLELLEATEARLLADYEERSEHVPLDILERHLTKRKTPATVVSEQPAAGPNKSAASNGRPGKTLSSALNQGSSSSWKPENWDKLSDKKQNAILIERLKSGQPID